VTETMKQIGLRTTRPNTSCRRTKSQIPLSQFPRNYSQRHAQVVATKSLGDFPV